MVTIRALVLAALSVLAAATNARAETGIEAAIRSGYGVPFGGGTDEGDTLSDSVIGQVPIWIDFGYRVLDPLFVGLYFQYGFGLLGSKYDGACELELDCSASDVRFGVQAHYHFAPAETFDPWLGFGFGYEWLSIEIEGQLFNVDDGEGMSGVEFDFERTMSGLEYLSLHAGLDIRVTRRVTLGPFVSFSLAAYDDQTYASCSGRPDVCLRLGLEDDDNIVEQGIHHWLMLGLRGAYLH
jgi:hypothetical protein